MGKANRKREEQQYQQAAALNQQAAAAGQELSAEGKDLLAEGKGYRTTAADFYRSILQGGPEAQRVLSPQIQNVRRQYQIGRESLDRNIPRGGARIGGQRFLAQGEASDVGRLFTDRVDQSMQALANLGVFGTQTGIGGVAQGANTALGAAGSGTELGKQYGALAQRQFGNFASGAQGIGKLAMASSRDFKQDIQSVEGEDLQQYLEIVKDVPLFTFRYRPDFIPGNKVHVGVMVEDSPDILVNRELKMTDPGNIFGVLMAAVKVQQTMIEDLTTKVAQMQAVMDGYLSPKVRA